MEQTGDFLQNQLCKLIFFHYQTSQIIGRNILTFPNAKLKAIHLFLSGNAKKLAVFISLQGCPSWGSYTPPIIWKFW